MEKNVRTKKGCPKCEKRAAEEDKKREKSKEMAKFIYRNIVETNTLLRRQQNS